MVIFFIWGEGPASPRWVFSEGVETFSYDNRNRFGQRKSGEIAVFWDPTYLKEKKAMIESAGKHISRNPAHCVRAASSATAGSRGSVAPPIRTGRHPPLSLCYTSHKLIAF